VAGQGQPGPRRVKASAPDPRKLREEDQRAKAKAKAKAFNDYELNVHVGDDVYTFRGGAVTFRHTWEYRKATGSTDVDPVMGLVLGLIGSASPPPDYAGQLVYLARLQAGETVTLDEVLDGFTMGDEIWLQYPDEAPDPGGEVVAFPDPSLPSDGSEG
jgi:hypothetical protein